MPHVNTRSKEVTAKIVFYGPGFCGKTTNLQQLHEQLPVDQRGRMVTLDTAEERTLLFDMMPVQGGELPGGFRLKFQLTTVPGQVYYNASRRLVLQGADGIVFVADSQPSRIEANVESMQNLHDNLAELGMDIDRIPVVVQYNKRDVPGALPVATLQQALNYDGWPAIGAVALSGEGVQETLDEITRHVRERLAKKR